MNTRNMIPLSFLIVALSIGYYFMIYLPQRDDAQKTVQEQQRQDQIVTQLQQQKEQQTKKEQQKTDIQNCLAEASVKYSSNWNAECKSEGKLTDKCISLTEMTFDEYAKQNNLHVDLVKNGDKYIAAMKDFDKQQADCSCRLQQYNADVINKSFQDDKDLCLKEFPQN